MFLKLTRPQIILFSILAICVLSGGGVAYLAGVNSGFQNAPLIPRIPSVLSSEQSSVTSSLRPTIPAVPTSTPRPPVQLTGALVDCVTYGITLRVTKAYCEYEQEQEKESKDRWAKTMADLSKQSDFKISPPPTLTPLTASPTPPSCNYSAKAAYDAQYHAESSKLYQQYQSALATIASMGASDSSAPAAAYNAYSSSQHWLDSQHAADLASVYCN
jgi:hypothetical protein